MRPTSNFPPKYWASDRKRIVLGMGCEHQVMLHYLYSGPNTHQYGIFYLPVYQMAHDLSEQFTKDEAERVLDDLEEANIQMRDRNTDVIWVYGMAGENFRSDWTKNEKQFKGAENQLKSLPESPVCKAFAEKYNLAYGHPLDTLPIGSCPVLPSPAIGIQAQEDDSAPKELLEAER